MNETIVAIKDAIATLTAELEKVEAGNKSAAARARKATLALAKLGKQFREQSIAELK